MKRLLSIVQSPVVLLIGLAGAFVAGRYTSPTSVKVIEVEKRTEIHHEAKVVERKWDITELQQVLAQFASSQRRDVVVRRIVETSPDGTKRETEESVDKSTTDTTASSASTSSTTNKGEEAVKVWKETVRVEEKVRLVEKLKSPDAWRVGVAAGLNLRHPITGIPNYVPGIPDQLVVGVSVDRRILGPLHAGAWLNSRLDGGMQLSVGF